MCEKLFVLLGARTLRTLSGCLEIRIYSNFRFSIVHFVACANKLCTDSCLWTSRPSRNARLHESRMRLIWRTPLIWEQLVAQFNDAENYGSEYILGKMSSEREKRFKKRISQLRKLDHWPITKRYNKKTNWRLLQCTFKHSQKYY